MEPQIGFCKTPDGVRIAYATLGRGPAIVIAPGYFHIIAFFMTIPEVRHLLESLSRYHTVVYYNQHGAGLSDRNRTVFTLESELQGLETVVDHLKLDPIILFGSSMSGPVVIAYTAKYPQRVTHLVLYGTYANCGKFLAEEYKSSMISLLRQPDNWLGTRTLVTPGGPMASVTDIELLVGIMRDNITPETAAKLLEMDFRLDVTHLCPGIKTPTLVMHRKGDLMVEFKLGIKLASLIPGARFIPLEGNIHYPFLGDTESFLNNIREFLGESITDDKATKAARPTAKKSGHDVFISFAFEDRESAAKIHAHLKDSGICPFWCEDITAGGDYPQLLGEAIRNSKSFLVVLSDSSDNSASVRKETTIAHNNKKPIIPVRIEDILPKNLEYLIANSLFFDAFPQPLEQHLPKLASGIKKIIGGKAEKQEKTKK